jgi:hypothetical protein
MARQQQSDQRSHFQIEMNAQAGSILRTNSVDAFSKLNIKPKKLAFRGTHSDEVDDTVMNSLAGPNPALIGNRRKSPTKFTSETPMRGKYGATSDLSSSAAKVSGVKKILSGTSSRNLLSTTSRNVRSNPSVSTQEDKKATKEPRTNKIVNPTLTRKKEKENSGRLHNSQSMTRLTKQQLGSSLNPLEQTVLLTSQLPHEYPLFEAPSELRLITPLKTVPSSPSVRSVNSRSRSTLNEKVAASLTTLQLLQTKLLQWFVINARAEDAFRTKQKKAEQTLYCMLINVEELRTKLAAEQKRLEYIRRVSKLEAFVTTQWENISVVEENLTRSLSEYTELATLLKDNTHVLAVQNVNAPADILLPRLRNSENLLQNIIEQQGHYLCQWFEVSQCMVNLEKTVRKELTQLQECRELLLAFSELEALARSLMLHILQLEEFKMRFETIEQLKISTDSVASADKAVQ